MMTLLLALLAGCGGASDKPILGEVSGKVSFEGKPLEGASIMFEPPDGRPAFGKTNAEGHYVLTYIRSTRGCKVGNNKVSITTVGEGVQDEMEEEGDQLQQSRSKPTREIIPPRYNSQSALVADVKPGKNTINFELTKEE